MDIGSAIAVFLVLSIVMLALFCFVTKYFHYKLKRAIEETNEVYSMVDEVYHNSEEDVQGDYEEMKEKVMVSKAKRDGKKKDNEEGYIEMVDIKTPLKNQEDIYQGKLREKLNGGIFQMISKQQSSREISELKSFRPEKLNTTNRTNRTNAERSNIPTTHTFIHKLVCYNQSGITVCDIIVKMIRKVTDGVIKESKTCKVQTYSNSQQNFDDQLEIMGFEKHFYGCYKYETSVDVSNMKTDENYLVKSLKTSERKEQITEEEYQKYRAELVNNPKPSQ